MKERPILFSGPMVRAILAGTKTQTRRALKAGGFHSDVYCIANVGVIDGATAVHLSDNAHAGLDVRCPFGAPGDRLWGRETWHPNGVLPLSDRPHGDFIYRADIENGVSKYSAQWKPSIFMPRGASRITLEVTDVRSERLNSITASDAVAEGVEKGSNADYPNDYKYYGELEKLGQITPNPVWSYESLWEFINGKGSWKKNPWVWVVTFKRVTGK